MTLYEYMERQFDGHEVLEIGIVRLPEAAAWDGERYLPPGVLIPVANIRQWINGWNCADAHRDDPDSEIIIWAPIGSTFRRGYDARARECGLPLSSSWPQV